MCRRSERRDSGLVAANCGRLAAKQFYCSSTILPLAYSKRLSFDRNDRPSRFSDSASSGSTMASTSRTTRPPSSTMASRARGLDGAVGGGDGGVVIAARRTQAEPRCGRLVQRHQRGAGVDHEVDALTVDAAVGLDM